MSSSADHRERSVAFRRNEGLEDLLARLHRWLAPAADASREAYRGKELAAPLVLVLGPPRSGTTLITQVLATSGGFGYPSNLLSRFYAAPILGAMLQRMLVDPSCQFRDEFSDVRRGVDFVAANGKTSGLLAPNEFWYFWRRYLPDGRGWYEDEELADTLDPERLCAELAGVTAELGAPFACKGMIFNHNVPALYRAVRRVLFLRMRRDPADVIPSLLRARERQYGDVSHWYSFEVPGYQRLRSLAPRDQVAGQVLEMEQALDRGLSELPAEHRLEIDYAKLCQDPAGTLAEIAGKLEGLGAAVSARYQGPARFEIRHQPAEERQRAKDAYRRAQEP